VTTSDDVAPTLMATAAEVAKTLRVRQWIRVRTILSRFVRLSPLTNVEYESFKATFGPERPPSDCQLRRLKKVAAAKTRTHHRIRMELTRRFVTLSQRVSERCKYELESYEPKGLSLQMDYMQLCFEYRQAAHNYQAVLGKLETAPLSAAPLLLGWSYNPESCFLLRSPLSTPLLESLKSLVDVFLLLSSPDFYMFKSLVRSAFVMYAVLVSYPLASVLATENLENAPSTQNPSGDQPSSQNAPYSNSGSGPSPHRSSRDQSSSNEAPEGNGTPYDVPSDSSSTTSSLAVDLSVGVYSHATLKKWRRSELR
jgi:hypothetical protein